MPVLLTAGTAVLLFPYSFSRRSAFHLFLKSVMSPATWGMELMLHTAPSHQGVSSSLAL